MLVSFGIYSLDNVNLIFDRALHSQNDCLTSISYTWQVGMENAIVEFLELVCYCANKCRTANVNFCGAVATHLNKLTTSHNFCGDFNQVPR